MGMRLIVAFVLVTACEGGRSPDLAGRICDLGITPTPNEVVVSGPALECESRTCLRMPLSQELPPGSVYPGGTSGLCSAECETDDDCTGSPETPCVGGFACAVAVTVGPFCCQKLCMCRDYGVPSMPATCDPTNPANTCANL